MKDYIQETKTGIYRVTPTGQVFTQTKRKIPLNTKGRSFSGEFLEILEPEKEMTYTLNNRGYLSVGIMRKTFMVHRLVAQAFIKNPENKPFVNHIIGNKTDNRVENLEWCTTAENNAHARRTGLHVQARGHKIKYKSPQTKKKALSILKDKSMLTPEQVKYVRSVYSPRCSYYGVSALAREFGISPAAMSMIIRRKTYKNID